VGPLLRAQRQRPLRILESREQHRHRAPLAGGADHVIDLALGELDQYRLLPRLVLAGRTPRGTPGPLPLARRRGLGCTRVACLGASRTTPLFSPCWQDPGCVLIRHRVRTIIAAGPAPARWRCACVRASSQERYLATIPAAISVWRAPFCSRRASYRERRTSSQVRSTATFGVG